MIPRGWGTAVTKPGCLWYDHAFLLECPECAQIKDPGQEKKQAEHMGHFHDVLGTLKALLVVWIERWVHYSPTSECYRAMAAGRIDSRVKKWPGRGEGIVEFTQVNVR